MNAIDKLHAFGQSLWYDNIERHLLVNGEMAAMVARGEIRGVTSNPSIFSNAIVNSHNYDYDLVTLAEDDYSSEQIYESLAIADIQGACDVFLPLYEQSNGGDGYVSLEVSPYLARDTEKTCLDAARLWKRVGRPNLMIKIPATVEGLPAITRTIAAGINVNVTLIFSIRRYEAVMDAYLTGLEQRLASGESIDGIASVASFFVSRIDSNIDARLQAIVDAGGDLAPRAAALLGKIAIANARLAFVRHKEVFAGERWEKIVEMGGQIQRALWASTSTKNPAYKDTLYLDELIGANTVNTVPPATLVAFGDHGVAALTLDKNVAEAQTAMDELAVLGISIDAVTQELEVDGVEKFAEAFTVLLNAVEQRMRRV